MSEGNIAADALRLIIERIERLEEEKKGIADDIKDVYAEAKATGYDVKTMRAIVRLRKLDPHQRKEAEALLVTYKAALGMDDMFAGHDGRSTAARGTGECTDAERTGPESDAQAARLPEGRTFKERVQERVVGAFASADDGTTDVTITTGKGVVFESKAAKARKAKASASAVH